MSNQIIFRRLVHVLTLARTDTTRATSTSEVEVLGIPNTVILKRAYWSRNSTFQNIIVVIVGGCNFNNEGKRKNLPIDKFLIFLKPFQLGYSINFKETSFHLFWILSFCRGLTVLYRIDAILTLGFQLRFNS